MNNQELELKLKEILGKDNIFDVVEATVEFDKEYRKTNFFKKTKMPLIEMVKNGKLWYTLNLTDIGTKIQTLVDNLEFENVEGILSKIGTTYGQQNEETLNILKEFKTIVK